MCVCVCFVCVCVCVWLNRAPAHAHRQDGALKYTGGMYIYAHIYTHVYVCARVYDYIAPMHMSRGKIARGRGWQVDLPKKKKPTAKCKVQLRAVEQQQRRCRAYLKVEIDLGEISSANGSIWWAFLVVLTGPTEYDAGDGKKNTTKCTVQQRAKSEDRIWLLRNFISRRKCLKSAPVCCQGLWSTMRAVHGTGVQKINVLQCVAVWCSVLQCVAVCCSVLQCSQSMMRVVRGTDVR